MHRLSIVIPCPSFDEHAEDTLVSVLENRPPHCQILVVTAGKYDDPYCLSGEVVFVHHDAQAKIVELVNRGFREAAGEIVHVLCPGARAVEGWTSGVLRHFDDDHVAMVSPAVTGRSSDQRALWIGLGYWPCGVRRALGRRMKLSSTLGATRHVLGPALVAGFYRRSAVEALDGFDERMEPACADIELALALRELGLRAVVEPTSRVISNPASIKPAGTFQTARHRERLYRRYRPAGWIAALAHAAVATWDGLGKFPHPRMLASWFGRAAAWFESGVQLRNEQRLSEARVRLSQATRATHPVSIRVDFSQTREKSARASAADRHASRARLSSPSPRRRAA